MRKFSTVKARTPVRLTEISSEQERMSTLSALYKLPETADLVTFTEEILNGKLHFLCSNLIGIMRAKPETMPELIFFLDVNVLEAVA